MIDDSESLDQRIFDLPPNAAVELGFALYVGGTSENEENASCAKKVVSDFDSFAASFPHGSRERTYTTWLRMAAISMSSGIARRKYTLNSRLKVAELELDLFLQLFARGQRLTGFAIAGLKACLLGGLAYLLMSIAAPTLAHHLSGEGATPKLIDPRYLSLCTAVATVLISAAFKEHWQAWRLQRARKRYRKDVHAANQTYQNEVVAEYKLVAETANNAWRQLTGKEPRTTNAFQCLLLGVLQSCAESTAPPVPIEEETLEVT